MPKVAIALHAWSGSSNEQSSDSKRYLTFGPGARIDVVEEREHGGWWAGRLDGRLGWFPSSFCRIEEDVPEADLLGAASSVPAQPQSQPAASPARPPSARAPVAAATAPPSAGASLAVPLRPQAAAHSAAPASRGPAFFADFELPLTSAAATAGSAATRIPTTPPSTLTATSTPPAPPSPLADGFSVQTPLRTGVSSQTAYTPASPHGFAASVGDFVGAGVGSSGETPLDKRLQSLKLPPKMATDAAAAAGNPTTKGADPVSAPAGRPIWQSLAFIDLFADAAGGARAALLASDAPPRYILFDDSNSHDGTRAHIDPRLFPACRSGAHALSTSMRFVVRLLRTLANESATAAAADTTFVSAHTTAGPLPELGPAEEGA